MQSGVLAMSSERNQQHLVWQLSQKRPIESVPFPLRNGKKHMTMCREVNITGGRQPTSLDRGTTSSGHVGTSATDRDNS